MKSGKASLGRIYTAGVRPAATVEGAANEPSGGSVALTLTLVLLALLALLKQPWLVAV